MSGHGSIGTNKVMPEMRQSIASEFGDNVIPNIESSDVHAGAMEKIKDRKSAQPNMLAELLGKVANGQDLKVPQKPDSISHFDNGKSPIPASIHNKMEIMDYTQNSASPPDGRLAFRINTKESKQIDNDSIWTAKVKQSDTW
jgi:hypothetical protein